MILEPCARCRRHVERASACPFCARRGVTVAGVVLTVASIGVAGCGGDPPKTDVPTTDTTTTAAPTSTPTPTGTTSTSQPTPGPTTTVTPPDDGTRVHPMYGVSQP